MLIAFSLLLRAEIRSPLVTVSCQFDNVIRYVWDLTGNVAISGGGLLPIKGEDLMKQVTKRL